MPLLPHTGATRGTLARYAHGNELLRRSAYAATRAALNFCGFLLVLRTLIKKKADSVSVFSVFSGCFVVEPRSLWMSAIPPTLTANFVFSGFDICKIQVLRNVIPKNDQKRQSVRFPD